MFKNFLILLILSSIFPVVKSQGQASNLLIERSELLIKENKNDSAMFYAEQAQKQAKINGDASEESQSLFLMGRISLSTRDYENALKYFEQSLKIRKELNDKAGISKSLSYIGTVFQEERKYRLALDYFKESLKYREQIGDKKGAVTMISKIGTVYFYLEDLVKAESHYQEALIKAEKINYPQAISASYNMLGLINMKLSDDSDTIFKNKALSYYKQGLDFADKQGNYREFVNCSNNIGSLFIDYTYFFERQFLHETDSLEKKRIKALTFSFLEESLRQYGISLNYAVEQEDMSTISAAYLSFGTVYLLREEPDSAIMNLRKAEKIALQLENPEKIILVWSYFGRYFYDIGLQDSAEYYTTKSYDLIESINRPEIKEWLLKQYSNIFERKGDFRSALKFFRDYNSLRDSLLLDQKSKLVEIQRYDYEKIVSDKDERLAMEKESARLSAMQNQLIIIILVTGLLAVLLFLVTLYRQNRKSVRLNTKLTEQKNELDSKNNMLSEKNDEINESIEYARRIQSSTLPDPKSLTEFFPDNFVFFKPRDVVSGDFYWWGKVEGTFVVTAADCTGHGVPGAFMSILGMSNLKEIVIKEYITHPGVILRRLRKEVINSLRQKGVSGEQQDGMDMALVSYNFETRLLQYSGAHNSLIVFSEKPPVAISENVEYKATLARNHSLVMFEYKADKMPVGIFPIMDRYKTVELEIDPGSVIVLYTDGYQDQFGGELPHGKKFMAGKFKKLLHENMNKSFDEQNKNLETVLDSWQGTHPQVDDITVLAFRV